jgi:hypothetical protein
MKSNSSPWLAGVLIAAAVVPSSGAAQSAAAPQIFAFESDEFWLDLHHYLYVLGRAKSGAADATREAVANAPAEAERVLQSLSEEERTAWTAAVDAYAANLSRRDLIFDRDLASLTLALAAADEVPSLADAAVAPDARNWLERVAPIYRRAWWPEHRAANRAFKASTQALVDRNGRAALDFVVRAYGLPWPEPGYPVHLVAYAHALGNYSTTGNLLVMSTNPNPTSRGSLPLEIALHEGMHQWDAAMMGMLRAAAPGKPMPTDLPHALIWMTAGEAVRRSVDGHVPFAEAFGLWSRGLARLRPALERHWLPYLEGAGTREEALAAVVIDSASAAPAGAR